MPSNNNSHSLRYAAHFPGIISSTHPVEGEHQLFGFLTTDANDVVGAIHPKAMPVILTTEAEIERWLTAPTEDALKLQRPLADGTLRIVATGERKDEAA
jgi:putative SOS response-associated peptidase YedK